MKSCCLSQLHKTSKSFELFLQNGAHKILCLFRTPGFSNLSWNFMRTVSLLWFSRGTRVNTEIREKKLFQPSSCLIFSFCKMKQIKLLIHHKKAVRVFNSQPIAYALLFRMTMVGCYLLMYFSTRSSRLNSAEKKENSVRRHFFVYVNSRKTVSKFFSI